MREKILWNIFVFMLACLNMSFVLAGNHVSLDYLSAFAAACGFIQTGGLLVENGFKK